MLGLVSALPAPPNYVRFRQIHRSYKRLPVQRRPADSRQRHRRYGGREWRSGSQGRGWGEKTGGCNSERPTAAFPDERNGVTAMIAKEASIKITEVLRFVGVHSSICDVGNRLIFEVEDNLRVGVQPGGEFCSPVKNRFHQEFLEVAWEPEHIKENNQPLVCASYEFTPEP